MEKINISVGIPPWTAGAEARLERYKKEYELTISIPEFGGEIVVQSGPFGLCARYTLNSFLIWEWAGNYNTQKEIFWHLAELLMEALDWAREVCPEAGFPQLEPADWWETDFGWRAKKDQIFFRFDPEDGFDILDDRHR